jgi:hypothetical protein
MVTGMARARFLALCAVAAAGLAASAAHGAEAKDPAPPAMLDEKSVAAWVAQNLKGDGWVLVNFDAEGVRLATPNGVSLMSDGLVETDIRHELFTPIQLSAGSARSGLAHWAVDCAQKRFAVISSVAYSHNNLVGEVGRRRGDRRLFQEPVASEIDTLEAVCEAIRTGKRLDGPAAKPGKAS